MVWVQCVCVRVQLDGNALLCSCVHTATSFPCQSSVLVSTENGLLGEGELTEDGEQCNTFQIKLFWC